MDQAIACGQVAQLVEQRTENPRVGGSTPSLATIPPSFFSMVYNRHSTICRKIAGNACPVSGADRKFASENAGLTAIDSSTSWTALKTRSPRNRSRYAAARRLSKSSLATPPIVPMMIRSGDAAAAANISTYIETVSIARSPRRPAAGKQLRNFPFTLARECPSCREKRT